MRLNEVRKEDNLYFQGPFWVIADSVKDILKNNFEIDGIYMLSDYTGRQLDLRSKNSLTHKNAWKKDGLQTYYENKQWNYYPRGRVAIHNGIAYIHINSICNIPKLIDTIIEQYDLNGLEIEVECNDTYQGSHYDFELE